MTTETIQGNKLIAEFMGVKVYQKKDGELRVFARNNRDYMLKLWAKYHTSWDHLMPVVEKIESLETDAFFGEKVRFPVTIATDKVEIGYDYYSNFEDVTEDCPKITAAWTVIVDFIQWYNQHLGAVSPHSNSPHS